MMIAPAVMLAVLSLPGQAADWQGRPVTVIVPLAAGGNTDMMARLAAQHLTDKLGQTFIVENRPSAGGAIATAQVAAAPPDGYTLLFTPSSMLLLTPLLQKLSFDPGKQLVPVTNVGTGAQVIAIKRELPAHTLPEFLAYAKANPGKLNFAVAERRTSEHQSPGTSPSVCTRRRQPGDGAGKRRGAGHLRSDRGPSGFLFWQRLAVAAPCRY